MTNHHKAAVIFLTGLSGAGKTTIAIALQQRLKDESVNPVMLDGDEIRKAIQLTGFDEESRKMHNLNVGRMAAQYEAEGSIVIVALIAPYEDIRNEIRKLCKQFIEVYVSTDIKVCIERDPKGLYKKALSGEINEFTGISAPYFPPHNAEVTIDTAVVPVSESVNKILFALNNIE